MSSDLSDSPEISQESEEGLDMDEFYNECISRIRVHPRNTYAQQRLGIDNPEEKKENELSPKIKEPGRPASRSFVHANTAVSTFEPRGQFLWYLLEKKSLLDDIVADLEVSKINHVFTNMAKKDARSHEAYFGLGKIEFAKGNVIEAVKNFRTAHTIDPEDTTYKISYAMAQIAQAKMANERDAKLMARNAGQMLIACKVEAPVESMWGMMEIALCGALSVGKQIENAFYYATQAKESDQYFGYIAWAEAVHRQNGDTDRAIGILDELIDSSPEKPEAYVKLWTILYHRKKDYNKALDIIERAFIKAVEQSTMQYNVLISVLYAKTLYKTGKYRNCFDLLQRKYTERPIYPIFLFLYGKWCAKSEEREFLYSGISALQECLRTWMIHRLAECNYWLGKLYLQADCKLEAYMSLSRSLKSGKHAQVEEAKKLVAEHRDQLDAYKTGDRLLNEGKKSMKTPTEWEAMVEKVAALDEYYSKLLLARIQHANGNSDTAMKTLQAIRHIDDPRLFANFFLADMHNEMGETHLQAEVMISVLKKCNDPKISATMWVEAYHRFAKYLVSKNECARAIMILKWVGKILPPLPIPEIQYTKRLQKATTLQEIHVAAQNIDATRLTIQSFTEYRNSVVNPYAAEYYQEEAVNPRDDLKSMLIGYVQGSASSPMSNMKSFSDFRDQTPTKTLTLEIEEDMEEETASFLVNKEHVMGLSPKPIGTAALPTFSVCSDPLFLYKIGKISAIASVLPEDGVCALNDFLKIQEQSVEGSETNSANRRIKALYYKATILWKCEKVDEAGDLFIELVSYPDLGDFRQEIEQHAKEYSRLKKN